MLHYKSMEWENFGSFEGYHKFDFASKGQHLITAKNLDHEGDSAYTGRHSIGSGKSTLTTIPFFVLYGDVPKKLNKDNIINKKAKKNLKTILEFSVNDTDYRIERYRKHRKGKNGVFLYEKIGGTWTDLTQSDIALTQQEIDKIILTNSDTYLKTNLLSREDLKQFLDYRPHERWKIFESIIQLNKMKNRQELILKKRKNQQITINKNNIDISAKQNMISHLEKQISDFKEQKEKKITEINQEINELNTKLETLTQYESKDIFINKIYEIEDIVYKLKDQKKQLETIVNEIKNLNNKKEKINNKNKILHKYIEKLTSQLENVQKIECHNCGALQNEEYYNLQLQQLNESIESKSEEIEENKKQISIINQTLKELEDQQQHLEQVIEKIKESLNLIKIDNDFKSKIYNAIKNKSLHNLISEIQESNNKLILKKEELRYTSDKSQIIKLEQEVKEFKKEYDQLFKQNKKEEKILGELEYLEDILDIRQENSIKQYAVSTVMPVFNELVRQNLDIIFDDQLTLVLDLLFNETIYYNNEEYNYHELSTGEKVKVNLSLNFAIFDAMRLNVMNTSAIFLDEILTNIDYPTVATFIKMIRDKYAKDCAVYTITHQPDAVELLNPQTITTVIKEDGCSRIEVN